MKEIKKAIDFYKARVRSRKIGVSLFVLVMAGFGIYFLISFTQVWWFSLEFFGFAIAGVIYLIFYVRFTRKKIKEIEKELDEAENKKS